MAADLGCATVRTDLVNERQSALIYEASRWLGAQSAKAIERSQTSSKVVVHSVMKTARAKKAYSISRHDQR
jgi:hypothetical protein